MKKLFLSSALAIVALVSVKAQSVADAVKDIYNEKFKSAKDKLQGIVSKSPNDVDANYWLGQVYIDQDDLPAARNTYAKAMTATNQAPLIMVGMGHVESLEGKAQDARAHFDAALAATNNKKGGDVKVLTAVGRANADGTSKQGDANYGIDKLQTAAKLDPKDPEIQTLIGISQLKRGPEYGGQAKSAYDAALAIDPKNARAKLRTARLYQSQNNPTVFIPLMEEATTLDPNYAPAYLALYDYYSERDVNKAKTYLDQFVAKADKDCNTDFFNANYLLRAGQRDASLAKAKEMESTCGIDSFPQLNLLYALIYDRNGDSVQGRKYIDQYLTKQVPAKITSNDYVLAAGLYAKFPEDSSKLVTAIDQAVSLDTNVNTQITTLRSFADIFGKQQNWTAQYRALNKAMSLRPDTTATNFYNFLNSAINAKQYMKADTIAQAYIQQYPTQPQGYALRIKATTLYDADTSRGTAIPAIDQYIGFLKADTAKNKNRIITYYGYEVYHFVNKVQDYPKALAVADSILALDPGNSYALQVQRILKQQSNPTRSSTPASPAKKATSPATKPKTTGKG
jgi:Flp pilus assembly protein TadD